MILVNRTLSISIIIAIGVIQWSHNGSPHLLMFIVDFSHVVAHGTPFPSSDHVKVVDVIHPPTLYTTNIAHSLPSLEPYCTSWSVILANKSSALEFECHVYEGILNINRPL